jgi:hypothetical protein
MPVIGLLDTRSPDAVVGRLRRHRNSRQRNPSGGTDIAPRARSRLIAYDGLGILMTQAAGDSEALRAFREQASSIPIVFVMVSDPVGDGFVASLSRPGGFITGFTNFEFSMASKWLEIMSFVAASVPMRGAKPPSKRKPRRVRGSSNRGVSSDNPGDVGGDVGSVQHALTMYAYD